MNPNWDNSVSRKSFAELKTMPFDNLFQGVQQQANSALQLPHLTAEPNKLLEGLKRNKEVVYSRAEEQVSRH